MREQLKVKEKSVKLVSLLDLLSPNDPILSKVYQWLNKLFRYEILLYYNKLY